MPVGRDRDQLVSGATRVPRHTRLDDRPRLCRSRRPVRLRGTTGRTTSHPSRTARSWAHLPCLIFRNLPFGRQAPGSLSRSGRDHSTALRRDRTSADPCVVGGFRCSAHQPVAHELADKSCGISLRITAGGVRPHRGAKIEVGERPRPGAASAPRASGWATCRRRTDDLLITRRKDSVASALYQRFQQHGRPQRARDSPCVSVVSCLESCHTSRPPRARVTLGRPTRCTGHRPPDP
jgi:hypothetical protein